MQKGPTEASQGVLLLYLTVAAAVSCSMLLRLIIIFSTGLFALQEVQVQNDDIQVRLLDAFSDTDINANFEKTPPFDILTIVLFENGTYPEGTTQNLVVQRFSVPDNLPDAVVTVSVDGLALQLDCESANIQLTK